MTVVFVERKAAGLRPKQTPHRDSLPPGGFFI
jgi:hypothetical protein